jgi:hypothetical protein
VKADTAGTPVDDQAEGRTKLDFFADLADNDERPLDSEPRF